MYSLGIVWLFSTLCCVSVGFIHYFQPHGYPGGFGSSIPPGTAINSCYLYCPPHKPKESPADTTYCIEDERKCLRCKFIPNNCPFSDPCIGDIAPEVYGPQNCRLCKDEAPCVYMGQAYPVDQEMDWYDGVRLCKCKENGNWDCKVNNIYERLTDYVAAFCS